MLEPGMLLKRCCIPFFTILTPHEQSHRFDLGYQSQGRIQLKWKGWCTGLVWVSGSYSVVSNSQPLLCKVFVHTCSFNWPGAIVIQMAVTLSQTSTATNCDVHVRMHLKNEWHAFHYLSVAISQSFIWCLKVRCISPSHSQFLIGQMMINQRDLRYCGYNNTKPPIWEWRTYQLSMVMTGGWFVIVQPTLAYI